MQECSPSSIFFENDLNNFKHEGKVVLSLEDDFFMEHDSRASSFLYNYLKNEEAFTDEVSAEYKFELTWFIVNLFWRIPNSNKQFEELIHKNGIHNKYFQIVNSKLKTEAPKEIIDKIQSYILNEKENRKAFKFIYPFISANSGEILRIMEMSKDFSILGKYKLITGDNPFILNNASPSIDKVFGELIFPFSNDRLLIASKKSPQFFNMKLLIKINLTILHQSERFVCSNDLDNLKYMIRFYKIYKEENSLDTIVENTFKLIYGLAVFPTLDEYIKFKKNEVGNNCL